MPWHATVVSTDASVVAAATDQSVLLWEVGARGRLTALDPLPSAGVVALAFVPGTSEILLAQGLTIERRDYRTGEIISSYVIHAEMDLPAWSLPAWVWRMVATSEKGRLAVSVRHYLYLFDLVTGEVLAARIADHIDPVAAQDNPINRMVFSPDGFRLATAQAHDYTVRLWNGETLEPIAATQGHTDLVVGITFSHDGTRIASSSWDYSIRLWDGLTGERLLALRETPVFRDVSPDTGRKNELRPARSRPRRAVFSSDDEQILSASEDGTVRRWRAHRSRSRPHRTGR